MGMLREPPAGFGLNGFDCGGLKGLWEGARAEEPREVVEGTVVFPMEEGATGVLGGIRAWKGFGATDFPGGLATWKGLGASSASSPSARPNPTAHRCRVLWENNGW